LVFGEYGPGGGFQAGTLPSAGVILSKLVQGNEDAKLNIRGGKALMLAGAGAFFYAMVGYVTLLFGGRFLEYEYLPLAVHALTELHLWGILGIEIGVTVCVAATFIAIFSILTGEGGIFGND